MLIFTCNFDNLYPSVQVFFFFIIMNPLFILEIWIKALLLIDDASVLLWELIHIGFLFLISSRYLCIAESCWSSNESRKRTL